MTGQAVQLDSRNRGPCATQFEPTNDETRSEIMKAALREQELITRTAIAGHAAAVRRTNDVFDGLWASFIVARRTAQHCTEMIPYTKAVCDIYDERGMRRRNGRHDVSNDGCRIIGSNDGCRLCHSLLCLFARNEELAPTNSSANKCVYEACTLCTRITCTSYMRESGCSVAAGFTLGRTVNAHWATRSGISREFRSQPTNPNLW